MKCYSIFYRQFHIIKTLKVSWKVQKIVSKSWNLRFNICFSLVSHIFPSLYEAKLNLSEREVQIYLQRFMLLYQDLEHADLMVSLFDVYSHFIIQVKKCWGGERGVEKEEKCLCPLKFSNTKTMQHHLLSLPHHHQRWEGEAASNKQWLSSQTYELPRCHCLQRQQPKCKRTS